MHVKPAVILFLQIWFNKCISKKKKEKLDVIWIYSMYLYILLLCDNIVDIRRNGRDSL